MHITPTHCIFYWWWNITILFVSSLIITTTIQILFIKYKQSLLITLKKTFQSGPSRRVLTLVRQNASANSLQRPLHDQILSYQSMLDLCVREIPSITFFGVSQEEMVNIRADLEDRFAKSKTLPGMRGSHHFVPISCNKIAHKLTSDDKEFLQFDFNKSLTKEIDI